MDNKTNDFVNPSSFGSNITNDNKIQQIIDELQKQTILLDQILNKNEKVIQDTIKNEVENKVEENIGEPEVTPIVEAPITEVAVETPVVNELPSIETPVESVVEEVSTPVVTEAPVVTETPVVNQLEESSENELKPVLEQTMELPQDNLEQPVIEKTEPSIIGIDELLKNSSVANVNTPVVEEVTAPVANNETPIVSEPVVEQPVQVQSTLSTTPTGTNPLPVEPTKIIEPEPLVTPTPTPNQTPVPESIPTLDSTQTVVPSPVVPTPISEPVSSAPVQPSGDIEVGASISNIEILNSDILNGVTAHANQTQRTTEVNSNNFNNQISNQKTLINKAA